MRNQLLMIILILLAHQLCAQNKNPYQTGISAEENLRAIGNITATSIGGMGFDNRYKGIKGSPMLFDTLLPSFLKIINQDNYVQIESDIDLIGNSVHFMHPKTKQIVSVSGSNIAEIIINRDGSDLIFRTMEGKYLNRNTSDFVFYQILYNGAQQLVKVPIKEFIEADYKRAYSPDRQYDELNTSFRYYIISNDGTIHPCQLTEKSLIKIFPEKKELIKSLTKGKSYPDKESMAVEVLKNL